MNGTFVIHYFLELIFIDDFLRDVFNADVNAFWSFERCHKVKIEMSIVMNLAFLVETILLKRIFSTNIYAVGVATSPG